MEVKNTGRHLVDDMNCNENDITPEIEMKRNGQHKGTCNFQKVTVLSLNNPIL